MWPRHWSQIPPFSADSADRHAAVLCSSLFRLQAFSSQHTVHRVQRYRSVFRLTTRSSPKKTASRRSRFSQHSGRHGRRGQAVGRTSASRLVLILRLDRPTTRKQQHHEISFNSFLIVFTTTRAVEKWPRRHSFSTAHFRSTAPSHPLHSSPDDFSRRLVRFLARVSSSDSYFILFSPLFHSEGRRNAHRTAQEHVLGQRQGCRRRRRGQLGSEGLHQVSAGFAARSRPPHTVCDF